MGRWASEIWMGSKKMKSKKSWREKLANTKDLPRVVPITESMSKTWGKGTMVIPAPMEVDEIMKKVPKGKVTTIEEIRSLLARKHGATIGCPMTTGIFAWIAAYAAEEEAGAGRKRITPYWRTLKTGGILNEKYPGGIEAQREKLESEGHRILRKGKKYLVEDLSRSLLKLI
jgi:alkylated DNA nucleotide flippase Atl1